MSARTQAFRKHVRAAAGMFYRMDAGHLTGRNSAATDAGLGMHVKEAAAVLQAACDDPIDPLPEYLDSPRGRALAESWKRVERRYYGAS